MADKNMLVLQNCTDAPRVEHALRSEKSVRSSDDSTEDISTKIKGEEICIKEEDELIPISFSSLKDKTEVSPQMFH
jgi:hypothetical protein